MSDGPFDGGDAGRAPPGAWIIHGMAPEVAMQAQREAERRNMVLGRWLQEAIEHALRAGGQ